MSDNRIRFSNSFVLKDKKVGINTINPQATLDVGGNVIVSGISTFNEAITGTISTATKLETARTFEITGDVVASPIAFDGTGNVSLAATIQPNSVGLGTDTFGDYVESISGTTNEITVTGGTGEGSTPVISFAPNPTISGNVTIGNDLQVNNNLNVTGNITVGGTAGYILVNEFRVTDADIVLGFTTDISGNDVSNDTTANHGGIAVASTEGNPLITLTNPGVGETLPATYKKIMWFKAGSFAGLNTDAWLSNYAIGIGSTQFPSGTRLAAGAVQFTENDLAVVRNINASGIVTAPTFVGNLTGTASTASFATTAFTLDGVAAGDLEVAYARNSGIATNVIGGIASVTQLSVSGITTLSSVGASQLNVSGVTTSVGGFVGNLTGTATTATNLADAANITTGTINAARLTGTYNIDISGNVATADYADLAGIATYANTAGVATYASNAGVATDVVGGIASVTQLSVSGVSTLGVVTAGNIFSTGIVTALTFVGNLTGTASTASFATTAYNLDGFDINTTEVGFAKTATNVIGGIGSITSLTVSGITTLGSVQISAGIITSSNPGVTTVVYYGDGSNLEGVTAFYVDTQVNTSDPVYPTLASGVGVNSVGISTTKLVFVESTSSLGIGTTNPVSNLDIDGPIISRDGAFVISSLVGGGITTWTNPQTAPNVDHIWHFDGAVGTGGTWGLGGIWNFVSDSTYQADGNSWLRAGGFANTTPTLGASYPLQISGNAYVSGNVGIGTTYPTSNLDVRGDVYISGIVTATDFNSASDSKLKTNIKPIETPIEKISQIIGVSFNWISDNKPSMGVVADDLQNVLPELVSDTDPKTVNYNGLIGLLIECVKEQQVKIEELEKRIQQNLTII
jgi:hypothetical protein